MIAATATEGMMPNAGVMNAGSDGSGDHFDSFAGAMRARFTEATSDGSSLFRTSATDLGDLYLASLSEDRRQHHTCSCCRAFLKKFGGLAVVAPNGRLMSALWDPETAPEMYREAAAALARAVEKSQVRSPFLASEAVWGTPEAGGFTHFALKPAPTQVYRRAAMSAGQAMAAKREDFRNLSRGLSEYSRETITQALTLLEADALYRSEKVIGPGRFLLKLHDDRAAAKGSRDLVTWKAVASAPPGFCTPRSSMIGTLLDDIVAGLPFEDIKRKFAAKMHPLQYQRPQAAPSLGNLAQAEKLVAQMGLEPALHRRFARLEEIRALWLPEPASATQASGSVFGHLKAKGIQPRVAVEMPAQQITFEKFRRTVLPTAKRIEVRLAHGAMNFCGIVTATNADAPPILQWDGEDARNPVSWYVYHGGSSPSQWGLTSGAWVDAAAIALLPCMWGDEERFAHMGKRAFVVLDKARDERQAGLALFPEILRSDLHAVRASIEAYSRSGKISGREEASANGLILADSGRGAPALRVTSALGTAVYAIDRWD